MSAEFKVSPTKSKTEGGAAEPRKKPYVSPALVLFGDVGALTQSGVGSCMSDNGACALGGTNMTA